jgi:hypothetical protein
VLAAEDIIYNPSSSSWSNMHQRPHCPYPDGGNDCHADGSVSWIKIEQTYELATYDLSEHLWYFYQDDVSCIPASALSSLKWRPNP